MLRWQQPEWLSLVALGTDGGQALADGSVMATGIHLRWDFESNLGFPTGGFDIFRREHLRGDQVCAVFFPRQGGGIDLIASLHPQGIGSKNGPKFVISTSRDARLRGGCGKQRDTSLLLPGEQTLHIGFDEPMRSVEIRLDISSPLPVLVEAFWRSDEGNILVDRARAREAADGHLVVRLFADRIDFITLSGTDMLICQVCVVPTADRLTINWPDIPINGEPIFLPVTHPDWAGVHPHSPDDSAEVAARLPAALSQQVREAYQDGFDDELHSMLYDLVGMRPQRRFYVDEVGSSDSDLPAPDKLRWQALQLLRLMALDPNLARILGLYWQDSEVTPGQFYDYQIVGHWGDRLFPGRVYNFDALTVGTPYTNGLTLENIQLNSPNPMTVASATWDESATSALQIEPLLAGAPLTITLPPGTASVTLRLKADSALTVYAYHGGSRIEEVETVAGENTITIEHAPGITDLRLDVNTSITLVELVARWLTGSVGDLHYVTFRHRIESPPLVPERAVTAAVVLPGGSTLADDGSLLDGQTVGLRWELPSHSQSLMEEEGIFYFLRRAYGGNGNRPELVGEPTVLNPASPTLITEGIANHEHAPFYLDRLLPDGWYAYQVQAVDLFGRLSDWGERQIVRVRDSVAPPPPTAISASYLDADDPYLPAQDVSHAPGIKVAWEWSGFARLQAPDVTGDAGQFRIYGTVGDLNTLQGNGVAVTDRGTFSALVTDAKWNGSADELAGEWARIGTAYFEVIGNTTGDNFVLLVNHLTTPPLKPQTGSFSLVYSPNKPYWTDYREATRWGRRLHVEPAVDLPVVVGQIVSVSTEATSVIVTTDQRLNDDGLLTAGVLVSNGMIYHVTSHAADAALTLTVAPRELAGDPPTNVQPAAGNTFVYYPGRRYQVYLSVPPSLLQSLTGTAAAHISVSTSDGKAYVEDDPRWNAPQRGALGDQPGNESAVGTPCKIIAVQRAALPAPGDVPPAGATPIYAQPANYFGQALYTLNWSPVTDASEYAVYRCSSAALFDQDSKGRRERIGFYATGDPFADDPGFADWLAAHYSSLTAATLTTEARRDWAAHFYPTLDDAQLQALANHPGNEAAFRRVNSASVTGTSYTDTIDGRGQGAYLYRIRAYNASRVPGVWSETYPPVHTYDITPPAPPVVTGVTSGERSVTLNWRANAETDLAAYHLWRAETSQALTDVRRLAPTAVITPTAGTVIETYPDENLLAGKSYAYRLAAVDQNGNVSEPTPVYMARPVDTAAPIPPEWHEARWTDDASAVLLGWTLADETYEILIQRSSPEMGSVWFSISSWLPAVTNTYTDPTAVAAATNTYRLRVRSASGNLNAIYNEIQITPPTGELP